MSEAEMQKAQMQGQAKTWPEHDCHAWNVQHWHTQADANWSSCGTCGRITGFRWKSLRRRLVSFLLGSRVDPR